MKTYKVLLGYALIDAPTKEDAHDDICGAVEDLSKRYNLKIKDWPDIEDVEEQ